MKPETLEHALHLWPDWYKSIENARKTIDYIPGQSLDQLIKWRSQNNSEVWTMAEKTMKELKLPQSLRFYWICCFYAN